MTCKKFDEALLEAVDFAFRSLGPSCQQSLYFHLKMAFRLTRRNIPERVEKFDEALKFIFKDAALILEKLILKRLCERLKVGLQDSTLDFAGSIFEMKRAFSSSVTLTTDFETASLAERERSGESETKS
jgi:hypothetical protein